MAGSARGAATLGLFGAGGRAGADRTDGNLGIVWPNSHPSHESASGRRRPPPCRGPRGDAGRRERRGHLSERVPRICLGSPGTTSPRPPGARTRSRRGAGRPKWGSAKRGGSAGPRRGRTAGGRRFPRPGPAPARPRRPEAARRKSLPAPSLSPQSPSPSRPIKMAAATAPRGPPRQPAPGVRRPRGASGATAARAILRERGGRGVPFAPTRSSEGPRSLAHPLWCRDPTRSRRPPPPRVLRASSAAARKPASDESPGETRL